MKKLLALAVLLFVVMGTARASVIVIAPTASVAGSFTITQDITFTITTGVTGGSLIFVMDEWVTSDGSQTFSSFSPALSLAVNGGAAQPYSANYFVDNYDFTGTAATPNDGYFFTQVSPALAINDTVTLKAATYTISAVPDFNPQATQTFTGNMFVVTGGNNKVSNTVSLAVPEPASITFLAAGGLALFARRRRIA